MTATDPRPTGSPGDGDSAPDFTLQSTDGTAVTLSAQRGQNVLLAFFPLAFTSTCTTELCDMSDDWDAFKSRGLKVFPISVDSVATLKEYKAKYGMQVDLLSDFKREVSTLYGTLLPEKFYSNRAYFLVDKNGIVRWAHHEQGTGQKRSHAEIFARVDAL